MLQLKKIIIIICLFIITGCSSFPETKFYPEDGVLPAGKVNEPYFAQIKAVGAAWSVNTTEDLPGGGILKNGLSDPNLHINIESSESEEGTQYLVTITGTPTKVGLLKFGIFAIRYGTMISKGHSWAKDYPINITE